jgi:hypothetical protein
MKSSQECIEKYDVLYSWCQECELKAECPFVAHALVKQECIVDGLDFAQYDLNQIVHFLNMDYARTMSRVLIWGKVLSWIRDTGIWKQEGTHIKRFDDFLDTLQPCKTTAYNWINIYEIFGDVLQGELLQITERKLLDLKNICKKKDNKEKTEILEYAKVQKYSDFKQYLRNLKGLKDCEHQNCEDALFCPECGRFFRVNSG